MCKGEDVRRRRLSHQPPETVGSDEEAGNQRARPAPRQVALATVHSLTSRSHPGTDATSALTFTSFSDRDLQPRPLSQRKLRASSRTLGTASAISSANHSTVTLRNSNAHQELGKEFINYCSGDTFLKRSELDCVGPGEPALEHRRGQRVRRYARRGVL